MAQWLLGDGSNGDQDQSHSISPIHRCYGSCHASEMCKQKLQIKNENELAKTTMLPMQCQNQSNTDPSNQVTHSSNQKSLIMDFSPLTQVHQPQSTHKWIGKAVIPMSHKIYVTKVYRQPHWNGWHLLLIRNLNNTLVSSSQQQKTSKAC